MHVRLILATAALAGAPMLAAQAQQQSDPGADFGALLGALNTAMQGNTNASPGAAVVDFRELKALLPADLPGFTRKSASGEKVSPLGMTSSSAEGRYEGAENATIRITITDRGGGGFASLMQAGWAMTEIDRETDTGYERTVTIGGHKGKETYDTANRHGTTEILVAGRFMVEITGNRVTAEQMAAAVQKLDLAKLAALKK